MAAEIEIGEKQKFNVILSTFFPKSWVARFGSKDNYNIAHHYDPSKNASSTCINMNFQIKYATCFIAGTYYKDMINFFNNINYLKFGVASQIDFDVEGADDVLGLAKNYTNNEESIIWTMYENGQISSKSFSIKYFSDDNIQMYLGDEHEDFKDKSNTGSCQLLNKTSFDNLLWTCKLYSFGLISNDNSTKYNISCGYDVLFDTGSNVMILPTETLEKIKDELVKYNCYFIKYNNFYLILCEDINNLPHIFIELGNYILFLNNQELYTYILDETKNKYNYALKCYFMDNLQISIIGHPFFKLFHTKFDYENKVLKFYSNRIGGIKLNKSEENNDENKNENKNENKTENKNEGEFPTLYTVLISVGGFIIIIIIIIVIFILVKNKNKKEEIKSLIEDDNNDKNDDNMLPF